MIINKNPHFIWISSDSPTALSRPASPSGCLLDFYPLSPWAPLGYDFFSGFLAFYGFDSFEPYWSVFCQMPLHWDVSFFFLCVLGRKTPAILITSYQGSVLSTWLTRIAPLVTRLEMVLVRFLPWKGTPSPLLFSCCTLWKMICLCAIILKKSLLGVTCHLPSRNLVITQVCGFCAHCVSGTELGCKRRLQSRRWKGPGCGLVIGGHQPRLRCSSVRRHTHQREGSGLRDESRSDVLAVTEGSPFSLCFLQFLLAVLHWQRHDLWGCL